MSQSSPVDTRGMGAAEIAILLWAAVVGTSFFTLAPVLVGALIDHMQLTVREVGLITSGELAGSALGSTLVLLYGRRFPARATLRLCLVLAGVANLATATSHHFSTITLFRVVAGLGGGISFSIVNAAAAHARKPGHLFAAISIAQTIFGIVGFIGMPALISTIGLPAVFLVLGVSSIGCAIASAGRVTRAPIHGSTLRSSLSVTPRGALLLVSLFATYLTSTAVWIHLERIGVAARLASEIITLGLSVGMIAGVLGSCAATMLLIRSHNTDRFVMGGAAIMAISTGLLLEAAAPAAYLVALSGFNGALSLVTPLYLTKLAAEDRGDSRVLLAMLAIYLGLILGPLLGAGLVAGYGCEDLIHVTAGLFLAAALLAFGASRLSASRLA